MTAIWPLLEVVAPLMEYAQSREVFVCDFIVGVAVLEGQLYTIFEDPKTMFFRHEFWTFKNLVDYSHNQIHWNWVSNLNNVSAQLVFVANGEKIWAVHEAQPMDRDSFTTILETMKREVSGMCFFSPFLD